MSTLGRTLRWNHLQRRELSCRGPESGHREMVVDHWIETLFQQALLRLVNNRRSDVLVSIGPQTPSPEEALASLGKDQIDALVLNATNGIWLGAEIVLAFQSQELIKDRVSPDEIAVVRGIEALLSGIEPDTLAPMTARKREACWEALLRAQNYLASRNEESISQCLTAGIERINLSHSLDPKTEWVRWLCDGEKLAAAGWADLQPLLRVQWRDSDPLIIVLLASLLEFYLLNATLETGDTESVGARTERQPGSDLDEIVVLLTSHAEPLNRILSELRPATPLPHPQPTLEDLEQSLAQDPRNPQLLLERGRKYQSLGRLEEALADYSFVLHQEPTNSTALLGRAAIYAHQGHHERVAADCSQILRIDPHNSAALVARGLAFSHLKRTAQAVGDLEVALRLDPLNWRAIAARGQIALLGGDCQTALMELDQAVALCPEGDADLFLHRALVKQRLGDFPGARNDFDAAINHDTGRADILHLRGRLRLSMGALKGAINDFGEALARQPRNVNFLLDRAVAWELAGRYQRAIADCTEALEIAPYESKALRLRGGFRLRLGDPTNARLDLDAAISSTPLESDNWLARGQFWIRRGNSQAALADLDEAIRLAPDIAEAWASRAEAYQSLNEQEKALADLRIAVRLDPQYTAAFCAQQAGLHAIQGNLEDALADYTIALRLDPNHLVAMEGKHQIEQLVQNNSQFADRLIQRRGKALGREEYHPVSRRTRRKQIPEYPTSEQPNPLVSQEDTPIDPRLLNRQSDINPLPRSAPIPDAEVQIESILFESEGATSIEQVDRGTRASRIEPQNQVDTVTTEEVPDLDVTDEKIEANSLSERGPIAARMRREQKMSQVLERALEWAEKKETHKYNLGTPAPEIKHKPAAPVARPREVDPEERESRQRVWAIGSVVLLLVCAVFGLYRLANMEPNLEADKVWKEYAQDTKKASEYYKGRFIRLRGKVQILETDGELRTFFSSPEDASWGIQFVLPAQELEKFRDGDKLTVRGRLATRENVDFSGNLPFSNASIIKVEPTVNGGRSSVNEKGE